MATSDRREAAIGCGSGRVRRRVPLAIRMMFAALLAALVALGVSYGLRTLNL
jgi:hypothetical protein